MPMKVAGASSVTPRKAGQLQVEPNLQCALARRLIFCPIATLFLFVVYIDVFRCSQGLPCVRLNLL